MRDVFESAFAAAERWAAQCAATGAFDVARPPTVEMELEFPEATDSERLAGAERAVAHLRIATTSDAPLMMALHAVKLGDSPWQLLTDDGFVWGNSLLEDTYTLHGDVMLDAEEIIDVLSFYHVLNVARLQAADGQT